MSTGECSTNESGWTTYIVSPDHKDDNDEDEDRTLDEQEDKKQDAEDVDTDDSMASDASSGPSYQYGQSSKHRGLSHAGNKNERKYAGGKKEKQQEKKKQHDEKIKAAKHKADSAARSKKR